MKGPGDVMRVVEDREAELRFRIVRLSEDDALVEQAPIGSSDWVASDDETASRVYMIAFLRFYDSVEETLDRYERLTKGSPG